MSSALRGCKERYVHSEIIAKHEIPSNCKIRKCIGNKYGRECHCHKAYGKRYKYVNEYVDDSTVKI